MNSDCMLPVSTSSFYGPRTESPTLSTPPAVIDLVLLATDIDVPAPPVIHGSATSLDEDEASQPIKMRKSQEEFTSHDLEQLLGAVIDINPFMAPRSKIGDRWKEVAIIVQAKGSCQNREPETLKNKVSSLLAWVEVCDHILSRSPHTDNYIFREGRGKRLGHPLAGSSTAIQLALPRSQGS